LTASGPKQSHLQDFCTYEFTIRNHSRHKAHTVCLEVRLPQGLAFLEASGHGLYDSTSHLVRWDMASFAPAESQTVAIKGRAKDTGTQQGKVILKLGAGDQRETTWSTEVLPQTGPPAPRGEGTAKGGI